MKEKTLRNKLAKRGYKLHRCRNSYGIVEYYITDINNVIVGGDGNYNNMSLEDVNAWVA